MSFFDVDGTLFDVDGTPVSISSTETDWYVSGVGVVKFLGTVDGDPFAGELVSTNVPEPAGFLLLLVGLAGFAQSQGRRSNRH